MDERMLSWEQEIISHTRRDEYLTVLMETGKGILELGQVILSQS